MTHLEFCKEVIENFSPDEKAIYDICEERIKYLFETLNKKNSDEWVVKSTIGWFYAIEDILLRKKEYESSKTQS